MASRSKEEEDLRKLSVELRYFEQTAETLQQRLSMMNAAMTDLNFANATLENMEKEKENAEILVPIGGSSYVKAKLAVPDKVIIGLGAGVSIEKTLPEAKAMIKERLDDVEKTRVSVQQQLSQIVERINSDRNQMEVLLGKMREGQP